MPQLPPSCFRAALSPAAQALAGTGGPSVLPCETPAGLSTVKVGTTSLPLVSAVVTSRQSPVLGVPATAGMAWSTSASATAPAKAVPASLVSRAAVGAGTASLGRRRSGEAGALGTGMAHERARQVRPQADRDDRMQRAAAAPGMAMRRISGDDDRNLMADRSAAGQGAAAVAVEIGLG